MKDKAKAAKIKAFWEWFLESEDRIKAYFSDEEENEVAKKFLIESINNRVLDFGLFSWEIRPGQGRTFHFIISPNGSSDLLKLSKAIMRAAPYLDDWELYPAKPVRANQLKFGIYDNYMIEQWVDATPWQCVLLKKADQSIALLLEANTIGNLDEDTQQTAGEMLITNLLGEEAKIKHISKVEVVVELEEMHRSSSFPVGELGDRFWEIAG